MKSRLLTLALPLTLALCLRSVPAWAGNWYLGGGLEVVDVGDDMGVGVDTGTGFTLNFGYRLTPNFALDFLWGASTHTDDVIGDDFAYGHFAVGANFILFPVGPTQPYLTVGLAGHAIEYDIYPIEVSGSSLYMGGGVDLYLDNRNSIDASVRFHSWEGDWEELGLLIGTIDASSTVISICYNYHFLY